MINTIIQILLSIFIIAIMAFISYTIYNKEYINSIDLTSNTKKVTKIFSGILDYSNDSNIEYETFNKTEYTYLDINPSINQNGGAEYSYNFWLYFDVDTNDSLINPISNITAPTKGNENTKREITNYNNYTKYKYLILFYKGEKQKLPLNMPENNSYDCKYKTIDFDDQIIIKNPLVKIRNDAKEIVIDYNNINFPDSYNSDANILLCKNNEFLEERSNNKFGIKNIDVDKYKRKFNMITIVLKEQNNSEQVFYKQNANCKIYLNKQLISDRLASVDNIENDTIKKFNSRVMKSNFSKFHINPTLGEYSNVGKHTLNDEITETPSLQVADLTYFNYALTQMEIDRLYASGFNKYPATFKKIITRNFDKGSFMKTDTKQI